MFLIAECAKSCVLLVEYHKQTSISYIHEKQLMLVSQCIGDDSHDVHTKQIVAYEPLERTN